MHLCSFCFTNHGSSDVDRIICRRRFSHGSMQTGTVKSYNPHKGNLAKHKFGLPRWMEGEQMCRVIVIPETLKLTFSHLKMDGWKMKFPFGARPIFRGYVSFRGGNMMSFFSYRIRTFIWVGPVSCVWWIVRGSRYRSKHPKIAPEEWLVEWTREKVMLAWWCS